MVLQCCDAFYDAIISRVIFYADQIRIILSTKKINAIYKTGNAAEILPYTSIMISTVGGGELISSNDAKLVTEKKYQQE